MYTAIIPDLPLCAALRKHDVCFLLSVKAKMALHDGYDQNRPFPAQVGLAYVRGCELEGMLDNEGKVIEEGRYTLTLFCHCDDSSFGNKFVVKLCCICRP